MGKYINKTISFIILIVFIYACGISHKGKYNMNNDDVFLLVNINNVKEDTIDFKIKEIYIYRYNNPFLEDIFFLKKDSATREKEYPMLKTIQLCEKSIDKGIVNGVNRDKEVILGIEYSNISNQVNHFNIYNKMIIEQRYLRSIEKICYSVREIIHTTESPNKSIQISPN